MSQKVIVKFKRESVFNNITGETTYNQRPDFETTMSNVPNIERIHKGLVKEVVLVREVEDEAAVTYKNLISTPSHHKELTQEDVIKYLLGKDKTPLSVAKYLDVELDTVKSLSTSDNVA
jgi:hypothetical protein